MTRLLNVYKVFAKSKRGAKLTVEENALSSRVMALAIDVTDVYIERAMYED